MLILAVTHWDTVSIRSSSTELQERDRAQANQRLRPVWVEFKS